MRGFVLAAKVLQNLSVNIRFDQKDFKDLDDFISHTYPLMQRFLLSLAVVMKVC
jgi:hypothetical protein